MVALLLSPKGRGVADAVVAANGHCWAAQGHTGVAIGMERLRYTPDLQEEKSFAEVIKQI